MKWESYKVSELCTIVRGSSPRPQGDPRYYGGEVPRLMIEDITRDGMYVSPRTDSLTEAGALLSRPMKKGDLVITVSGRPGVPAILAIDACVHDGFVGFRDLKKEVNVRFLYRYLSFLTAKTNDKSVGAIFKNLTTEQIKNIEVPLPPLHIQDQIADTLDKADALRRKDQELLQKYDELAQAIFHDMFGDPVKNEKGWNICSIRDVCTFSQGVQIPLEEQSTEYRSGLYRFLRISDYTQTVEPRYVSLYDRKAYVQKDDIVMVRYGASAGYVGTGYEGILANNLFKLSFERATLTSEFLYFYLNSTYVRAFITEVAFGAAMPALSFKVFDNLNIILPPVKIQERFSEIIQLIRRSSTKVYKSQNLSDLTFETTSVSFFS